MASSKILMSVTDKCSSCPMFVLIFFSRKTVRPSGLFIDNVWPARKSQNHSRAHGLLSLREASSTLQGSKDDTSCCCARATYSSYTARTDAAAVRTGSRRTGPLGVAGRGGRFRASRFGQKVSASSTDVRTWPSTSSNTPVQVASSFDCFFPRLTLLVVVVMEGEDNVEALPRSAITSGPCHVQVDPTLFAGVVASTTGTANAALLCSTRACTESRRITSSALRILRSNDDVRGSTTL
mmetsp:Transcript_96422/g.185904  ORF Transcript_96422/g.185904 Transcript_96422/m.185904 type:complete len:238 (+) Transcript_96422:1488-2201(+)